MKWIVDRIEGDVAVLELSRNVTVNIPVNCLPNGVKENDVISLSIDIDEKKDRLEKIKNLENSLFVD